MLTPRSPRLTTRSWILIVVLGLTGQLAWTVENMYLNVFVYDTITDDPNVLATLVAASAVAATLATFVAGAWSDRLGNRLCMARMPAISARLTGVFGSLANSV